MRFDVGREQFAETREGRVEAFGGLPSCSVGMSTAIEVFLQETINGQCGLGAQAHFHHIVTLYEEGRQANTTDGKTVVDEALGIARLEVARVAGAGCQREAGDQPL